MAEALAQIDQLSQQAESELRDVKDPQGLEQFRIKFLGGNGQIKGLMKLLGQVPREQKPAVGQRVNAVKDQVTAAFEARKQQLQQDQSADLDYVDVTEPGRRPSFGNRHILM